MKRTNVNFAFEKKKLIENDKIHTKNTLQTMCNLKGKHLFFIFPFN